jgi:hypothetical protein
MALFSKTSLQSRLITPRNPRTIFFNDSVAVAWMRGGFIEIAAHDTLQGAVFYLLPQMPFAVAPVRENSCLTCHYSATTLGVPGFIARSIPTGTDGAIMPWLGNYVVDHRRPLAERWGGWYVTGRSGAAPHLGNAPVADRSAREVSVSDANLNLPTLSERFDTSAYLTPHSDVVALLVFDHQMHMMNLLTRIGWEARVMAHEKRAAAAPAWREAIEETVDYLLFVDEAPVGRVDGSSGFAATFASTGPRDRKGRSLRDLDLRTRLLKYPCSYMIYSDAFAALPAEARGAIYGRMWEILSGRDRAAKYARLTAADRQAIVEILRDTKTDLPSYYAAG